MFHYYFLFMCESLYICMHVLCSRRPEEGIKSHGSEITDSHELLCRYWDRSHHSHIRRAPVPGKGSDFLLAHSKSVGEQKGSCEHADGPCILFLFSKKKMCIFICILYLLHLPPLFTSSILFPFQLLSCSPTNHLSNSWPFKI